MTWSDIWSVLRPFLHLLAGAVLVSASLGFYHIEKWELRNHHLMFPTVQSAIIVAVINIKILLMLGDLVNVIADIRRNGDERSVMREVQSDMYI